MLLKGLDEAARAPRPFAAVEMLVIRMCYTAQLPSPADIIGELRGVPTPGVDRKADAHPKIMAPAPQTVSAKAPADRVEAGGREAQSATRSFASFEDIVAHAAQLRDIKLKIALEEQVELVKFGPGYLELHILDGAPKNLAPDLARKLQAWSGERWIVSLSEEQGAAAARRSQARGGSPGVGGNPQASGRQECDASFSRCSNQGRAVARLKCPLLMD